MINIFQICPSPWHLLLLNKQCYKERGFWRKGEVVRVGWEGEMGTVSSLFTSWGELSDTVSSTKVRVFASRSCCLLSHLTARESHRALGREQLGFVAFNKTRMSRILQSPRAELTWADWKGRAVFHGSRMFLPDLTHSCVHAVRSAQASVRLTIGASVSVTHTLTDTHTHTHGAALTTDIFFFYIKRLIKQDSSVSGGAISRRSNAFQIAIGEWCIGNLHRVA